uniref:Uncharacterized protein n=1 Tax=Amphimedon queenslandica TaxID=400682 RepID=A0A1X7T2P1_AMPQE
CDVNAKGRFGYTPLHYACEKGHFEIVKILTNHPQCNIEAEDENNDRPIHLALSGKTHMNIVNYLVEVKGCNTQGITTYDMKVSSYLHIHQSSGIALLRVVKCILTGPPGAGKSTLKKRLLNQSLDTGPSLSTGVIDAAVQVNSFRKLSQHNAVVTTEWKEQELDEEAVLITKKLLPADNTSDESTRPTGSHQSTLSCEDTETLSFENQSRSPEEIGLSGQHDNTGDTSSPTFMHSEANDAANYNEESSDMEHENIDDSYGAPVNCEEEEARTGTEVQNSNSSVVKGFSEYVMKIPAKKRQEYERKFEAKDDNHTMLHIIDTGGQPEFHEILPALITGPAINLLVFKLTEDLRSRYEIIYRTSAGDSKPYETSLTHEEVIFRSLASIACLRQNTIGWSFDETPIEDNRATYLEVWVQQIKGSKLSTSDLLLSLDKGLVTVTESLHYTYKSKHEFGVPCTCTAVPHPAVIDFNESATKCVNGRIVEFNDKQLYWSKKVVELNNAFSKVSPQTVCPIELFRHHSANIAQCISLDVIRVADRLFAAKVIPQQLRNEVSNVTSLDDYRKANKLTVHIQNILSCHTDPTKYLTDVCYALFHIDNDPLKHILISILNKLGKPLPQGSIQDVSKSSSLLNKRPRVAQDDTSASKRLETDPEGSYDNTFSEGQSSGSGILQNESKGHKRQREDDSSPGDFTKMKKSTTQS